MRLLIRKLGKIRDMLYPHHVIIRRGRVEWSVNNFRAEYFFFLNDTLTTGGRERGPL